jgi:hypothetical protein
MRLPGGRPVFLDRLMMLLRIDSPLTNRKFNPLGGLWMPRTVSLQEQGGDGHR